MERVYEGGLDETSAQQLDVADVRRLGYQPALDGVRGLAVALVVVFHLDVGIVTGGYLGVSVFFTLSGFLITSLLLERHRDTGHLGLGGFYVRRIKRLVPASSLTLLTVAGLTAGGGFLSTDRSRGDLVAAALNVFNWREVASGRAYADLFAGGSPVAHFWSLAIEEQFYVVWPLALLGLLRARLVGPTRLLGAVTALFLASALAAQFGSANVTYFASWTRAAEILAGAWLAVWLGRAGRVPGWWRFLAGPAIALVVLLSLITPAATGWAYRGGLPLFSLVSVAVIAGLQQTGRTQRVMSFAPIVGLGRISYGVYLAHWPVFVFVDDVRMGVDGWSLAVTRVAVTMAVALAMYALVERPVRRSTCPVSLARAGAIALCASLFVVGVTHSWVDAPRQVEASPTVLSVVDAPTTVEADPSSTATATTATTAAHLESTPEREPLRVRRATAAAGLSVPDDIASTTTVPVDAGPTTIAVFGDSVPAWLLRDAAFAFARRDVVLVNGASEACDGAVALPVGRDRRRVELRPPNGCLEWTESYPVTLASYERPIEIGLLVIGQAPVVDRYIADRWIHPCESHPWYVDDVRNRLVFLRANDVEPVIALPARFGRRADFILPDDYQARIDCVRASLVALAAEQQVDTVDLDGLLCFGDDCDGRRRRDGVHVDPEVAIDVLNELVDLTLAAR